MSNDCPFEVLGYFEEFLDGATYKFLGVQKIESPDRAIGAAGKKEIVLTEPLHLVKGYKKIPVVVKASPKQPRTVLAMIQVITGKLKG